MKSPLIHQNKKAEITFFKKFHAENEYDVFTEKGYLLLIDWFQKMTSPTPQDKVVDFGCGTAAFGRRLQKHLNLNVSGVDITPEVIESNRKKMPDMQFFTEDIENTSFQDQSFDIIIFSGVLHHFPDFMATLKEARRLLKKDGRIFAFDPNLANPFMWLYRCKNSPFYSSKGVTENECPLMKKKLESKLVEAGYSEISIQSLSGIPMSYVESGIARNFLALYNTFDQMLHWTHLDHWLGAFLITSAKK